MILHHKGNPLDHLPNNNNNPVVICNIASTYGPLRKGFTELLERRIPEEVQKYKQVFAKRPYTCFYSLTRNPKIYIAWLICIKGWPSKHNQKAFHKGRFKECLEDVVRYVKDIPNCEIHLPAFSCRSVYVNPTDIENILHEVFTISGIQLTLWNINEEIN